MIDSCLRVEDCHIAAQSNLERLADRRILADYILQSEERHRRHSPRHPKKQQRQHSCHLGEADMIDCCYSSPVAVVAVLDSIAGVGVLVDYNHLDEVVVLSV